MSYMVTIESEWIYDNEIFITTVTSFLILGNYQIVTLTYYRSYLTCLR